MSVVDFLHPENWMSASEGPLYVQLRQRLEAGIISGTLPQNTPLPAERDIAVIAGVSRVTVRKAIQDLAARGLIVQRQGSGSFIAPTARRLEQSLAKMTSFTEEMTRRGLLPSVRWLERGLYLGGADEVAVLGLAPEAEIARLVRLRLADGQPVAIERAILAGDILPEPTRVSGSLYACLEGMGKRPVRATQKISAINLDVIDAAHLGTDSGAAGLRIERLSYLRCGRVAESTQSTYRGDAYELVAELGDKEALHEQKPDERRDRANPEQR